MSRTNPIVLIVEDEPLVRMMAADFVQDAGFDVMEAENADEAMDCLRDNPDIAVVFTDIDMPGIMNGLELAHVVNRKNPRIGVIVASGHQQAAPCDLPPNAAFFQKPYDMREITSAIETMKNRR